MWTVRVERCWKEDGKGCSCKHEFRTSLLSDSLIMALSALRKGIIGDTETGVMDGEVVASALLEVIHEHR